MKITNLYKKAKAVAYTATLTVCCSPAAFAFQSLPQAPASDSDSGKKGFTGKATDYIMDGVTLLLLLMGTYALIRVAQNIMTTYGEISDGKATYRELGGSLVVGLVILSLVIYLLVEAAAIFGISV